ncbi:MAG: hypothetical protein JXQ73_20165 [Phycisphaerae bacterium]|nr:hypothetical protein [Phycisphaerae bacterium]
MTLNTGKTRGRWRSARKTNPTKQLTKEQSQKLARVMALPYVAGSVKARQVRNVTLHQEGRAYDGLNLFNSGHGPVALAMDMEGNILHKWEFPIEKIWPRMKTAHDAGFWRRVYWYPNGNVLAIFEGVGIVKLNRDSELLWSYDGGCHHQAYVTTDGRIYVLTREVRVNPKVNPDRPILEGTVTILNPEGRPVEEYFLLECFLNSEHRHLLENMSHDGELFHTNSIVVFDGSMAHLSPLYREGNILISMLLIDAIAIVDLDRRRVVWGLSGQENGMWYHQHDARLLSNGRMLLFDNRGNDGWSKVIEFDPFSEEIAWQYRGAKPGDFYTESCGISQRLPNGNTLITESDNGRAFEVTSSGKIVWEYCSPFRVGSGGELVATLFEMTRVDKGFFPWLDRPRSNVAEDKPRTSDSVATAH